MPQKPVQEKSSRSPVELLSWKEVIRAMTERYSSRKDH